MTSTSSSSARSLSASSMRAEVLVAGIAPEQRKVGSSVSHEPVPASGDRSASGGGTGAASGVRSASGGGPASSGPASAVIASGMPQSMVGGGMIGPSQLPTRNSLVKF